MYFNVGGTTANSILIFIKVNNVLIQFYDMTLGCRASIRLICCKLFLDIIVVMYVFMTIGDYRLLNYSTNVFIGNAYIYCALLMMLYRFV